ncbi:CMRF35-like molecule 9 isoform X2 [Neoarius graeffei]|uniref:CMRF35-like molecule 9 isoform X2 n=1 Tax=Neoarius graeffei TaxID=443677 RepID=UPI00298C2B23|nr:CMRF35-like molecule 9 isoform X2 [Neoarius graeffei]
MSAVYCVSFLYQLHHCFWLLFIEETRVISQTSSADFYIIQLTSPQRQDNILEETKKKGIVIAHCAEFRKKAGVEQKTMQTFLKTLSFFQVLICGIMKSKSELVVTGTVGGSVDISCKYADKYKYTPMYFCRNRCTSSDVLIESKRADMVVSKGRYTAVNTVTASRFSVIIRRLTLKDSGVYYCGVEKWGYDKFTKVKLTVKVSRHSQSSEVTEFPYATTVIATTADNSTLYEQASTTQTQHSLDPHGQLLVACGGVLGLMMCCVLAALLILYRKKPTRITSLKPAAPGIQISHPPPDQEDIYHVYDEALAVYSLAGPARDDSSTIYSTIQLPATADNDCSPYSLAAFH